MSIDYFASQPLLNGQHHYAALGVTLQGSSKDTKQSKIECDAAIAAALADIADGQKIASKDEYTYAKLGETVKADSKEIADLCIANKIVRRLSEGKVTTVPRAEVK